MTSNDTSLRSRSASCALWRHAVWHQDVCSSVWLCRFLVSVTFQRQQAMPTVPANRCMNLTHWRHILQWNACWKADFGYRRGFACGLEIYYPWANSANSLSWWSQNTMRRSVVIVADVVFLLFCCFVGLYSQRTVQYPISGVQIDHWTISRWIWCFVTFGYSTHLAWITHNFSG